MIVTLILAAVTLVYAFSFCTGSLAYAFNARSGQLSRPYRTDPINADALFTFVQGDKENKTTGFNSTLIVLCIVYIVIAVIPFITACHSRRKYYITNYVAIGLTVAFAVVLSIYAFIGISTANGLFNQLDFEKYQQLKEANYLVYYSDSPAIFAIGYALFVVVIVNAAVLVLNLLWKIKLMKGEKALLAGGLSKEVA